MVTITEKQSDRFGDLTTTCPYCGELLDAYIRFNPYCRYCTAELPDFTELIDALSERILYFHIGEVWVKGAF